MEISVIGLGYIGLPTAAIIAAAKVRVNGIDLVNQVVDMVNQGINFHITEPGLNAIVERVVADGYLHASRVVKASDVFIIAVPTPLLKNSYQPDLSYVKSAIEQISLVLKFGDIIIIESTLPVGTTEQMIQILGTLRTDLCFSTDNQEPDVHVVYSPERVLPGKILEELVTNDRVIGSLTTNGAEKAEKIYKLFVKGRIFHTNIKTAEMVKLTENSFRDVNIAFANELSIICDKLDIDVWKLISLANHHPRVNILQPGPGVGGHCIAVDPWFLINKTPGEAKLIHMARIVNHNKEQWVLDKVDLAVLTFLRKNPAKSLKEIIIACFGLTFKPDIDDLRESPALKIVTQLGQKYPNKVIAVEPNIKIEPEGIYLVNMNEALAKADILLLLVDHKAFKKLKVTHLLNKEVIDTKGVW